MLRKRTPPDPAGPQPERPSPMQNEYGDLTGGRTPTQPRPQPERPSPMQNEYGDPTDARIQGQPRPQPARPMPGELGSRNGRWRTWRRPA